MAATITTALLAIVVFVFTQSFLKLVLEPVQAQRTLVGEVAEALTVYEKAFTLRVEPVVGTEQVLLGSSREEAAEAAKVLRELAGRLQAGLWAIAFYDLFALFRFVPTARAVVVAVNELHMWYSQLPNAVNEHQARRIRECQDTISRSLGIEQRLQVIHPQSIKSEEKFYTPSNGRGD